MLLSCSRYWFATLRRENQHAEWFSPPWPPFASSVRIFPLNYLRALRDWPTNPVRLNNLPIIRGPLCFIRRVSNKSHCVFRRAASNSILWCEPSPRIRRWKKARWRNGRGNSRKGRSRTICTNWLEIRLNIANLWRGCEGTQCLSSSSVTPRNRKYC